MEDINVYLIQMEGVDVPLVFTHLKQFNNNELNDIIDMAEAHGERNNTHFSNVLVQLFGFQVPYVYSIEKC